MSKKAKRSKHKKPLLSSTSKAGESPPDARPEEPSSTSNSQTASATTLPQSDYSVELDGWVRLWEDSNGIPSADIPWLKEDSERGLFMAIQIYKDIKGVIRKRRILKSDRMWFYPPSHPASLEAASPLHRPFSCRRFFFWHPIRVWWCSLKLGPEATHTSSSLVTTSGYVTSAACPVGTPW